MSRAALSRSRSSQEELNRRKLARLNPWAFACYVDPHYAKPYSYPHSKLIFDTLKEAESGKLWEGMGGYGARILIITIPPNHLKSSITNKFAAWWLGKRHAAGDPHQIALVSYGSTVAETNSNTILNTIQEPAYKNIFPQLRLDHHNPSAKSGA